MLEESPGCNLGCSRYVLACDNVVGVLEGKLPCKRLECCDIANLKHLKIIFAKDAQVEISVVQHRSFLPKQCFRLLPDGAWWHLPPHRR